MYIYIYLFIYFFIYTRHSGPRPAPYVRGRRSSPSTSLAQAELGRSPASRSSGAPRWPGCRTRWVAFLCTPVPGRCSKTQFLALLASPRPTIPFTLGPNPDFMKLSQVGEKVLDGPPIGPNLLFAPHEAFELVPKPNLHSTYALSLNPKP